MAQKIEMNIIGEENGVYTISSSEIRNNKFEFKMNFQTGAPTGQEPDVKLLFKLSIANFFKASEDTDEIIYEMEENKKKQYALMKELGDNSTMPFILFFKDAITFSVEISIISPKGEKAKRTIKFI